MVLEQPQQVDFLYGQAEMSEEELHKLWVQQGAPLTYEQLINDWSGRIEMIARRFGFRGEDLEDIKSMIFMQFFQGDYFHIYDPRKSKFSTFMYNFISRRVLQQVSKRTRDPIASYVPLTTGSSEEVTGEMIVELIEVHAPRMEDRVESTEIIQEIRRSLAKLPQRGKRNLLALFDMMILDWPRSSIAEELGVSEATVCLMIKDLRETQAIKLLKWS